ncbi:hypothetical protein SADUNF_Sadunf10G0014100 [Salix dunnii]|uniref:Uncharacterized protein n=1 Tax=Salix dunnii TaxID=1413687 RepID=A0A835MXN4_9ROSI|nr:hypothetical protein SADUNF_Sadunf10G0014100 [Salix dunnii]
MPVELEGYIRPGCTILTVFLAMPTFMWVKLLEDPESYLNDLLGSGKMLSKKGRMCVYLNNMIFNVTKDGNSVMKVNVKGHAPRLHYVHPICFEAGKPIELVVCGSNLLQTKFRFLVSFAGKYLAHDSCVALPQVYTKGASGLHHQLYKIRTHCIEPNLSGPLFIEVWTMLYLLVPLSIVSFNKGAFGYAYKVLEDPSIYIYPYVMLFYTAGLVTRLLMRVVLVLVENESGLSNFIPVLIGDREVCSEMKIIQQRFDASRSLIIGSECEVSTMRQTAFSEFSMDIAWLLKEPSAENSQQTITSFQIRRVNSLLNFLLHHESIIVLDKILKNLKIRMDKREVNGMVYVTSDTNTRLLQSYMDCTSSILHKKLERSEVLKHHLECPGQENCVSGSFCVSNKPASAVSSEGLEQRPNGGLGVMANTKSIVRSGVASLLNRDVDTRMNPINERLKKSCGLVYSNRVLKYRPSVFVIAMIAVCFGVCAMLLHPHKVSKLAVSIRRCLTDRY